MIDRWEIKKIIHDSTMNYKPRKISIAEKIEVFFRPVNHPKISKFIKTIKKSPQNGSS